MARRSLGLVFAAAPRQAAALSLLLLLEALLPLGTLWASRGVVDAAARAFGVGSGSGLPLPAWIGVAVALIAAQQLLGPLLQAVQEAAADMLTAHVNGALITAANRWRGLARFEDPVFADHLALARGSAARGPLDLLNYGGRVVLALTTILAVGAILRQVQPLAPFLLVLAYLPQAVQENHFGQMMANTHIVHSADGRKLGSFTDAVLGAGPAKDVRLFNLGGFFLAAHAGLFGRMTADLWELRRRLMARMLPAQALAGAVGAGVYLFAVRRVLDGGLGLGDLVLFAGALLQLEAALTVAAVDAGFIAAYFTWLPSLFAVLDAAPDLLVPPPGRAVPAPRPISAGLVLEHVTFRYPGATADTLRDVSFALRPGERLALVGRNGAGKTTLVKLLARLYDPTAGRILLDGVDLRDYDLDDLRRQISVVFQDFVRYQLTAQENVGLGAVERLDDRAAVRAAADKGGTATLIERLPQGYATRLGSEFGGSELSGGEWQRIALSRAFMRPAQLLILDEPTAALDVQAEYDVYRRFSELTAGTMTVLVSHRFSTVRLADRICYLEDGQAVEQGSHDELLARDGGYARLYRMQAELYQ